MGMLVLFLILGVMQDYFISRAFKDLSRRLNLGFVVRTTGSAVGLTQRLHVPS